MIKPLLDGARVCARSRGSLWRAACRQRVGSAVRGAGVGHREAGEAEDRGPHCDLSSRLRIDRRGGAVRMAFETKINDCGERHVWLELPVVAIRRTLRGRQGPFPGYIVAAYSD